MANNIAIRLGVEGGPELKRVFDDAGTAGQAAFTKVGAAADQAGAATDRQTAKFQRLAQAAREAEAQARAQANVNALLGVRDARTGPARASASVFEDAYRDETEALRRTAEARTAIVRNTVAGWRDLGASGAATLANIEAGRRLGSLGGASEAAMRGAGSTGSRREVERLREELDDRYRNAQQYEQATGIIGRGFTSGALTEAQRDRLQALAKNKYGTDPSQRGLDTYDRLFVKYQATDTVQSLAAGMSPGLVALQQGGQVFQQLSDREGGLTAGLKQLGITAAGLVTPLSVSATAVAGLGAAFLLAGKQAGDGRETLEKATQGIGRTTGATAAQLDVLARANAEAGKVSASTAQEIVAGYASTGRIALPVIADLTRATSEYAKITGQDVPAATAELARMFSDPARGADDLAARIGGLDDRTRQLIRTQAEQGDKSAAQQTMADSLKASIDANATATTGWAAAWNTAAAAAAGYWAQATKIAGIKLGTAPEGAEEALARLQKQVDTTNKNRADAGMGPLELGSSIIANRDAAALIADTERRRAASAAAEEAASAASRSAGDLARTLDPRGAQLSDLKKKYAELDGALNNPLARSKLFNVEEVERAKDAYKNAIDTMTDSNGKLISSAELSRRQDQLRLDELKATTTAEKEAVAERKKALELAGKPLSALDAGEQITRAGILARAEADSKKGGGSDREKKDDYDRALRSTEDRTRRIEEQATTFGRGAAEVERYRVQQELLTAAQRTGRDMTPTLTREIEEYAQKAGDAARRNEEIRDRLRSVDDFRSVGSDGVRSLVRDLGDAKSGADILGNALERVKQRVLDLASDSIADLLFGKRGSSESGLLGAGCVFGSAGGFGEVLS